MILGAYLLQKIFNFAQLVPAQAGKERRLNVTLQSSSVFAAGTVMGYMTPGNDVQTVSVGSHVIAGSTFALTFSMNGNSASTGTLAYDISTAALQTALEALPEIGAGNVAVTGTAGLTYTITFQGSLANTFVPLMTLTTLAVNTYSSSSSSPTNSATITIAHTTPGVGAMQMRDYATGHSDGSQTAKALLECDCSVDAGGRITLGTQNTGGEFGDYRTYASVFASGVFQTADLTGLDATAVGQLGKLIDGSSTLGLLLLP